MVGPDSFFAPWITTVFTVAYLEDLMVTFSRFDLSVLTNNSDYLLSFTRGNEGVS